MGETFFDDLARTLAEPMPRRRALRLVAAACAVAAFPSLRPRPARAGSLVGPTAGCGGVCSQGSVCGYEFTRLGSQWCNKGCCLGAPGETRTVCCNQNREKGSWCCPTGFTCGSGDSGPNCVCLGKVDPRTGECNCPASKWCGNTCCQDHEQCENGECVPCEPDNRCGSNCCAEGAVCRNARTGLCCVKTWKACAAGAAGVAKCCPPTDSCCFNKATKTAKCCGPGVKCENGRCKCTKDETRCGEDCCKKGEICSKGRCCKKAKKGEAKYVNCDGKCCKEHLCINASGKKVCCPLDRVATPRGVPICCPPGTVPMRRGSICCPPSNPECCDLGGGKDLSPLCGKGRICANGVCV